MILEKFKPNQYNLKNIFNTNEKGSTTNSSRSFLQHE